MKKHSKDLYNLIKSLSSHEKRLYLSRLEISNFAYVSLFNAISKSKHYEEEKYIRNSLKNGIKQVNYPRIKHYLYTDILAFLAENEQKKKSASHDLYRNILSIQVLIERSLLGQAQKLLKKSKIKALKHNLFNHYSELLNLEYKIIRYKVNPIEIQKSVKSLKLDFSDMRSFQDKYMDVVTTELDTYYTIMGIQSVNLKNVDLVEHIDLKAVNDIFTTSSPIMDELLTINAGYVIALREHFRNNNKEAVDILKKSLAIFQEKPKLKNNIPYKYLLTINNLGDSALVLRDFDTTDKVIEELKLEGNNSKYMRNAFNDIYLNIESRRFWIQLNSGKESKISIEDITAQTLKKEHWVLARIGVETIYQLIFINFILERFSACIPLINRLLNENKSNLEIDTLRTIWIIELIIHSEHKNHQLVESRAQSLNHLKPKTTPLLLEISAFFKTYAKNNFAIPKKQWHIIDNRFLHTKMLFSNGIAEKSFFYVWLLKIKNNSSLFKEYIRTI